ncbi:MAG: tRNA epoxyqueuosine(34) reductase QueG [Tissierellaceae bacterium]|nr:tRNA epoxyqueuosine(34) reductase QueG [Tissierellaceae bacterium]
MLNIKEYILSKSKELGIDIIGFTDAEALLNIEEYLQYRIKNNINTEFEETDIEKRINPKITFPDCKSIIVIGISYNVDIESDNSHVLKGSLSKSSWGMDYHKVLKTKIEELILEIEKKTDFSYKYFVDTGPLVDRELAKKAGIGYYGKNCSIINEEYGSFIFIGYILTDLDLEIDESAVKDDCGDCDLCIRSCPTNALTSEYVVNPKRCISYLTQTKGDIPEEFLEKMGTKIYGCDTCQLVCPKNKDVKKSCHKEFIPEITKGIIDIKELLNMSNREFKDKYGSMAGSWRGKNILKRNAIIALGNMKDIKNIDLLLEERGKDNPKLNFYIDWALDKINNNDD